MSKEVVVLSAVRSAIGTFGGSLKDMEPGDLGALVIKGAIARAGVDPQRISYAAVGNCIPSESRSPYVGRVASVKAGLDPAQHTSMTVNRICGSGLQAIISTAQAIQLGDAEFGIGAGTEVMSKGGYLMPAARYGARMGDTALIDMMVAVLTDPFENCHMGMTAENIAAKWGITRAAQDALALESQRRAAAAFMAGRFKEQILPIEIPSRKGVVLFDTDEHLKPGTTLESLAALRPAFKKDGSVTAGNASGVNDGAAALILAEAAAAQAAGLQPMARLVAWGIAGVDNKVMGEGPIAATKIALKKAGLTLDQMDVIEANEAFAVQALAVMQGLGLDPDKTNPNGGAIALGHPVGASGAIVAVKAIHELQRIAGRYALVTLCIGGGQGISAIFERC